VIDLKIRGFEWDSANIGHMAKRHGVTPEEAEEVFDGNPVFRKTYESRRIALGQTGDGRYLFVVFMLKEGGVIRVITARDMVDSERRYYQQARRR